MAKSVLTENVFPVVNVTTQSLPQLIGPCNDADWPKYLDVSSLHPRQIVVKECES